MTNYTSDSLHFLSAINPPSGGITNTGSADSNTIINNYSVGALGSVVTGNANAFTTSNGAIAAAISDFLGISSSNSDLSFTSTNSTAFAADGIYQALSSADVTVLASFSVDAYKEFSFDFTSTIDVATQVGNPNTESAEAAAQSSFLLLDAHNGNLVDYFTVSGGVVTPSQNDFFLSDKSQYVDVDSYNYNYDFWGNQESVEAVYQGSYERTFYHDQDLVLVEVSSSHVELAGDFLIGNLGHDVIYGTLGDDVIYDNDSTRDKIYASHGDDTVYGSHHNNIIEGGLGNDRLYARNGHDSVGGGTGNDYLYGEYGNDTLKGGNGDDYLDGGDGNDRLYGGNGHDQLHGGNGNDHLYGNDGNDIITGGYGFEYIDGGSGNDTVKYDYYGGGVTVNLVTDRTHFPGNSHLTDTVVNIENVVGSLGNDSIYGDNQQNILDGSNGNDYINGGNGNDDLKGGHGDDTLKGGHGDDYLYGDGGNDKLYGEAGNDVIIGGYGFEHIDGGSGNDTVKYDYYGGGVNVDLVTKKTHFPGNSHLTDTVVNIENVTGSLGHDDLYGNNGHNILKGSKGNDDLIGRGGNDTLNGTDSNAAGSGEYDTLNGGSGADRFILGDDNQGYYNDAGWSDQAVIKDFNTSQDVVQLHDGRSYWLGNWDGHASYLYEHTSHGWDAIASFEGSALNNNNLNSGAFDFV